MRIELVVSTCKCIKIDEEVVDEDESLLVTMVLHNIYYMIILSNLYTQN